MAINNVSFLLSFSRKRESRACAEIINQFVDTGFPIKTFGNDDIYFLLPNFKTEPLKS